MSEELKFAIVGCGRIGNRHAGHILKRGKLVAVCDIVLEKAELLSKEHGCKAYSSVDKLLDENPDIDVVAVCSPNGLHAEHSILALKKGFHVLCEKPFAMNADEARAMLAASEKSGKRLVEAFHYRYHPAFETCLAWLAADEIGELKEIHAAFDVAIKVNGTEIRHHVETGGGAMMDLGCYPLHWALTIAGTAPSDVKASAKLTKAGVDESLHAELAFASGVSAHLTTDMSPGTPFRADMKLIGSKGEIEFIKGLSVTKVVQFRPVRHEV